MISFFSSLFNSNSGAGIDAVDESGMTALHWAVLKDHEICTRILLDRGADVDALQKGLNTPLLLAALAPTNSEILVRLLIERGADITTRNLKDHDVVFMAVLYGHASKGLPWLLQLLNAKGLDLNAPDGAGATPLHLCAKKNLSRPIRMLVDRCARCFIFIRVVTFGCLSLFLGYFMYQWLKLLCMSVQLMI